jgi:hypothetical protein
MSELLCLKHTHLSWHDPRVNKDLPYRDGCTLDLGARSRVKGFLGVLFIFGMTAFIFITDVTELFDRRHPIAAIWSRRSTLKGLHRNSSLNRIGSVCAVVRRTHGRGRLRDEGSTIEPSFCWNSGRRAGLYSGLHDDARLYPLAFLNSLIA